NKLLEEAFAAAAKEKSACPSKDAGGDVNFFARNGMMVEPFAKAAFALKPYQMTEIVKTQYGYHLILVTDRKPGTATKFESVSEEIKEVYGMLLLSWLIALPEYALQVPANRMGMSGYGFSTAQLKIFAEAFSLVAFVVFNYLYFQVKPNWQTLAAFGLIFAAVVLIVDSRHG